MVELIAQYPWLLYVLLALSCVVLPLALGVAAIGFIQGREVSTPLLKIGSRPSALPALTDDQVEAVASRVSSNLKEYRNKQATARKKRPFSIPGVPRHTAEILALQLAMGRIVRDAVLSTGGGWAGSSIADFERFFDIARRSGIISESTAQDIADFNWLVIPGIYGDQVPPEQMRDIRDLAAKILKELASVKKERR